MFSRMLTPLELTSPLRVNAWKSDSCYVLQAEVPGVEREDLTIEVKDRKLKLAYSRTEELPDGSRLVRRGRPTGNLTRVFQLPEDADASNVEAALVNGLLTIKFALKPEAQPKRIEIK